MNEPLNNEQLQEWLKNAKVGLYRADGEWPNRYYVGNTSYTPDCYLRPDGTVRQGTGYNTSPNNLGYWNECEEAEKALAALREKLTVQQSEILNKDDFSIEEFPDGAICLSCGKGMEKDLIFASGAMRGDPLLEQQKEILNFILKAIQELNHEPSRPNDGSQTIARAKSAD